MCKLLIILKNNQMLNPISSINFFKFHNIAFYFEEFSCVTITFLQFSFSFLVQGLSS